MFFEVLIAGVLTFIVFIIAEFASSIRQFLIFKKVREEIVVSAFNYLKQTPVSALDLNTLREQLLKKLSDMKLSKWVSELRINWNTMDSIQFVFELKFDKVKPRYKFVIGLNDINDGLKG